jgi:hypothetical protein
MRKVASTAVKVSAEPDPNFTETFGVTRVWVEGCFCLANVMRRIGHVLWMPFGEGEMALAGPMLTSG